MNIHLKESVFRHMYAAVENSQRTSTFGLNRGPNRLDASGETSNSSKMVDSAQDDMAFKAVDTLVSMFFSTLETSIASFLFLFSTSVIPNLNHPNSATQTSQGAPLKVESSLMYPETVQRLLMTWTRSQLETFAQHFSRLALFGAACRSSTILTLCGDFSRVSETPFSVKACHI